MIDRAEEHFGPERAARYLRKFYPWYADGLGLTSEGRAALMATETTAEARSALDASAGRGAAPMAA